MKQPQKLVKAKTFKPRKDSEVKVQTPTAEAAQKSKKASNKKIASKTDTKSRTATRQKSRKRRKAFTPNEKATLAVSVVVWSWMILAIIAIVIIVNNESAKQTSTEPLSTTSELNSRDGFFSSEDLEIDVNPPGAQNSPGPNESGPEIEQPPTVIRPGRSSEFSVNTANIDAGSIEDESRLAIHGYWSTNDNIDNNGAEDIRISIEFSRASTNREDHMGIIIEPVDSDYRVFFGLKSAVTQLGGNRGAEIGYQPAIVDGAAQISFTSGTSSMARLIDWSPDLTYILVLRKNTQNSDSSTNHWDAHVQTPAGEELLVGSLSYPASAGKMRLVSTYLVQYGGAPDCGNHSASQANFFNQRSDGLGAVGASVNLRQYSDCAGVSGYTQFNNNGYTAILRPGSR